MTFFHKIMLAEKNNLQEILWNWKSLHREKQITCYDEKIHNIYQK